MSAIGQVKTANAPARYPLIYVRHAQLLMYSQSEAGNCNSFRRQCNKESGLSCLATRTLT
eukprot:scaffold446131_cov35-Prasinocladus_malaysianus.AAC.3